MQLSTAGSACRVAIQLRRLLRPRRRPLLRAAATAADVGEIDGKRARFPTSSSEAIGEDCLSALPEPGEGDGKGAGADTAAATRTSVLYRRWCRVWALLPELSFTFDSMPDLLDDALPAHEVDLLVSMAFVLALALVGGVALSAFGF